MEKPEDFEILDMNYNFTYVSDLYDQAKIHGYDWISELIWTEYYTKSNSLNGIGKMLKVVGTTVKLAMVKWGFERRSRGGNNYKGKYRNKETIAQIYSYKGNVDRMDVVALTGVSQCTISKIWNKNKQYKEFFDEVSV